MRGSSRRRVVLAVVVSLIAAVALLLLSSLAGATSTGEITGTVTNASGGAAIEGIEVCPSEGPEKVLSCVLTSSGGEYTISGLATGEYHVEFTVPRDSPLNYVTQYYNGKSSFSEAESVSVTSGNTTPGIDAKMVEGGEITGTVTGAPLEEIEVCALAGAEPVGCAITEPSGEYTISGLATGSYTVEFSAPNNAYVTQYYSGKPSPAEAEPVSVTAGNTTPGIDAKMVESPIVKPVNTKPPELTGTPAVGETVSCSNGTWSDRPTRYVYEWLQWLGNEPIRYIDDTSNTYTIQEADEGYSLACVVIAENYAGGSVAESSRVQVPFSNPPVDIKAPELVGLPVVGQTLYCSSGEWSNALSTYSYTWLRDGVAISGQTESTYTVQEADEGHTITCEVTATNPAGPTSVTTNSIMVPVVGLPVNTEAPKVTGTPAVGQALSCSDGEWLRVPYSYTYRWLRDGAEISGQTASTYKVGVADEGQSISCEVIATNTAGSAGARSNELSVPVAGATTGEITGTVTSASGGGAVEGLAVCAHEPNNEHFGTCSPTNSGGVYTISGLAAGSYKVQFDATGAGSVYLTQYYNGKASFSEAESVSVTAGSITSGIDARMVEGGKIAGKVTSASSGNAIEGIDVCAAGSSSDFATGMYAACANTTSSGEYTLSGLASASYKVEFLTGSAPALYLTQYYNGKASSAEAESVSVTAGSTTSGIDAQMVEGGKIAGKVTSAPGGAAIEGLLACTGDGSEPNDRCAITNSNGEYTLAGLASGSYKVTFKSGDVCPPAPAACVEQNYATQYYNGKASFSEAESVSVTAGSTTSGIDARMVEGGKIAGKVTNASNGAVSEGVEVCALAGAETAGCASTNASGEYTISGLASGSYKVRFSLGERVLYDVQYYNGKASVTEAESVSVTAGSATSGIDAKIVESSGAKLVNSGEGSTISSSTPAEATDGPLAATASGGTGSVIVGRYESDPVGAPAFESSGKYIDVFLAPGSDFGSLSFTDCELNGGEHLAWYDAETKEWQDVSDETAPSGNPPCITVTIDKETKPDLEQMTGTVFGVALPPPSTPGSNTGGGGSTTGGGGGSGTPSASGTTSTTTTSPAAAAATGRASLASSAIAVTSSGKAQVRLTCTGTAACAGKLTLTAKAKGKGKKKAKTETIGTGAFSIPAGKTATVTLTLTGTGRALLSAAHGRLSVTLTILKSSPSPSKTQTESVHLAQQKATKAKKGKK